MKRSAGQIASVTALTAGRSRLARKGGDISLCATSGDRPKCLAMNAHVRCPIRGVCPCQSRQGSADSFQVGGNRGTKPEEPYTVLARARAARTRSAIIRRFRTRQIPPNHRKNIAFLGPSWLSSPCWRQE